MKPQNFEESLVWYWIISTYVFYFIGILYPVNFVLAWILFFYLCKRLWNQTTHTSTDKIIKVYWIHWVWIVSILVIAIATLIGCINYEVGTNQTLRSLINWFTDWALLALFPLSGCLNIRPQVIYRAVCILCLQSLILIPFFYLAWILHLPAHLYSSPIERLIQNGELFYNVNLYGSDYGTNDVRLFLFAPWAPALGLIGNIYFFLALEERNNKWRWIGIVGSLTMSVVSVSRLSFIALPIVFILVLLFTKITKPTTQIAIGFVSFLAGIFSTALLSTIKDTKEAFYNARPDSSRVHEALGVIALEKWKEAPIWGHGFREAPGPKALAEMPIGSHHTWFGLLFVKGIVGFTAFLVPILLSFIVLLIKAQKSTTARVALYFLVTLLLFTFNDSQEALGYLYYPGLIIMGIAFKEEVKPPNSSLNKKPEAAYI
ncbi:O-antigen ligase family protein [Nostoc sp.]|uniref:O-antigen ligase family protein n=1 Tax=Nostoc sp. TaxID=1180 RepID=UPI002FF6782C